MPYLDMTFGISTLIGLISVVFMLLLVADAFNNGFEHFGYGNAYIVLVSLLAFLIQMVVSSLLPWPILLIWPVLLAAVFYIAWARKPTGILSLPPTMALSAVIWTVISAVVFQFQSWASSHGWMNQGIIVDSVLIMGALLVVIELFDGRVRKNNIVGTIGLLTLFVAIGMVLEFPLYDLHPALGWVTPIAVLIASIVGMFFEGRWKEDNPDMRYRAQAYFITAVFFGSIGALVSAVTLTFVR